MSHNLSKIKSYIGFAEKSRNLVLGQDNIAKSKNVALILVSDNLAESSLKKLETFSNKNGIVFIKVASSELLSVFPRDGVKVIGISDKNLSDAIIKNLY